MTNSAIASEEQVRVEIFSSDVLRAQAKRKTLRKKLLVLCAVKLISTGATYLAYETLVSIFHATSHITYVNAGAID